MGGTVAPQIEMEMGGRSLAIPCHAVRLHADYNNVTLDVSTRITDSFPAVDVLVARAVALEAKRIAGGVTDQSEVANLHVPIGHAWVVQSVFELSRFQWPGLGELAPM